MSRSQELASLGELGPVEARMMLAQWRISSRERRSASSRAAFLASKS